MHSVCLQLYKKQSSVLNFPKKNPKIAPIPRKTFTKHVHKTKYIAIFTIPMQSSLRVLVKC